MEILKAFYQVHYNFAMVSVLLVMLGLYLLSRRNNKGFLIAMLLLVIYNGVLFTRSKENPRWWEESMARLEQMDFVDWLWGANNVEKSKQSSEERMNQ